MANELDDLALQQYNKLYHEDDVPLMDVRRSTLRRMIWVGLGLFVLILIAGFTIRFPDEVTLPFVLRSESPERVYRYPYPVYIEESFTKTGAQLKAGDPLLRITSPQIVAMIRDEQTASAALANYRANKPRYLADTRAIVGMQAEQNTHMLREIRQRQATLERTWKSNEERLRFEHAEAGRRLMQNQALFQTKHISALELKTYESEKIRAADALTTASEQFQRDAAALREEAARYTIQNRSLSRESDRYGIEAQNDSTALLNALAQAREAIRNSFGDYTIEGGSLLLRAGLNGTVSFLFEGERELPQSAILLRLRPQESGVFATAVSSGALIGKLRQGQAVYLKVSSFPAYEWGAAKGHIDRLSLTPDESGGFSVRVVIDDARRLNGRMQGGMDGRMAVQLHERSFFQYFFRNLRRSAARLSGNE
jgi:hypothetical protein